MLYLLVCYVVEVARIARVCIFLIRKCHTGGREGHNGVISNERLCVFCVCACVVIVRGKASALQNSIIL